MNKKSIKSQRKIAYTKIFFKFSIKIHWKILRKNIKKKIVDEYIWNKFKKFQLSKVNRFENFQKNMQNKYNNMKQNVNEKIKKYVERFDVILKRLNKIKRRNSNDKLQNFIRNFRSNHQLELYKHLQHVNRQNLKITIQRFENAKYYRNKHDKKK